MKTRLIPTIILLLVLSSISLIEYSCKKEAPPPKQTAKVQRGDLVITVSADGNLNMPNEAQLKFGTMGTVKEVYVAEGDKVKAGTLLAKLDDTTQKLTIASAQYDVELAMNDLVGKIYPALLGYPEYYPDSSTLLRLEQSQEELTQVQELLRQNNYKEAAAKLHIAQYDLKASHDMLNLTKITTESTEYDELGNPIEMVPDIPKAIKLLEQDQEQLAKIKELLEKGKYEEASAELGAEQQKLEETHRLVNSVSGRIRVSQRSFCCGCGGVNPATGAAVPGAPGSLLLAYPDTSTSLDWLRQVEGELNQIQKLMEQGDYDKVELAKVLRMAQNDVEMSHNILKDNELIFRNGIPLKDLRTYNLNRQKTQQALEKTKQELMKTEILAPFDGTVVDVAVKVNDQLSSFDYSSKTAVHLVDTTIVKMDGVIDEVDIYKAKVGQEAIIIVDALPGVQLKGKVTFISPFGTSLTGVVNFPVTISLESIK